MEIEPAWNTWDSVYPAQMTYLPLGLTVTPCAYAASTGTFSTFPATAKGLALGTREIDASAVNLHLALSGTELEWHYQRTSARQLRGGWEAQKFGEWGLRFWVMLVLRLDPGHDGNLVGWRYDPGTGTLSAHSRAVEITVAGYARITELAETYTERPMGVTDASARPPGSILQSQPARIA